MSIGTSGSLGTPNFHNRFSGRAFTTRMLRDAMGPDDPRYHLLMMRAIRNVAVLIDDDFPTALTAAMWAVANSGGGSEEVNFAQITAAGDINGIIRGNTASADGNNDNDWCSLRSETIFNADHRPTLVAGIRTTEVVTSMKWEFGFSDGDNDAGAVNDKDTPSSTATDYAVAIFDTDSDDTIIEMISDGTTDAVASQESAAATDPVTGEDNSLALPAWALSTAAFTNVMVSVDEQRNCHYWVDSVYGGRIDSGPENDGSTALCAWAFVQSRVASAGRSLDIDYVLGFQNRLRLPHSVD